MNPNIYNGLIMFVIILALIAIIIPYFIPAFIAFKVTVFNIIQLVTFIMAVIILRKK